MNKQNSIFLKVYLKTGLLVLICSLVSCINNHRIPYKDARKGAVSGPKNYTQPQDDGAPWWQVDVSKIPDAVPQPHLGPYKAAPYKVFGVQYYPMQDGRSYHAVGEASWYGTKFHGRNTASGEKYDLYGMTAAHKTLPLPTYVKVTNLENGKSVVVRVNDRGPFYSDRVIDLSFAAAEKLGYARKGVAKVKIEGIDPRKWQAQNIKPKPINVSKNKASSLPLKEVNNHQTGLYLQVGAFSVLGSAQNLMTQLQSLFSTPAFIVPIEQNNILLYRVRLGPFDDFIKAQKLSDEIKQNNLGSASMVKI